MTKFKVKNRKLNNEDKSDKNKVVKKSFVREDSPNLSDKSEGNEDVEFQEVDCLSEDGPSGGSSRAASPVVSESDEHTEKNRRYKGVAKHRNNIDHVSDFIDPLYWKR